MDHQRDEESPDMGGVSYINPQSTGPIEIVEIFPNGSEVKLRGRIFTVVNFAGDLLTLKFEKLEAQA